MHAAVATGMRALLPFVALSFVASCRDVSTSPEREAIGRSQQRLANSLSVTSGVSGTVTTLAYYSAGNAHPGQNSVDIGAPGGAGVHHQLDYLPSDVAGGWLRTYVTKDAGYCSQWSPGSPYYNGAKLIVVTYLYATDGTYLGWHRSAYQHVSPNASVEDAWWRWNNSSASVAAWQSPDVSLGAQQSNGLELGTVFGVSGNITNGPGGGLCTTGSHLHQEGTGWRGSALFVGKGMTDRYNDVHLFDPIGGWPITGEPPYAPEFYVAPIPVGGGEEQRRVEEKPVESLPKEEAPMTIGGAGSADAPTAQMGGLEGDGEEHSPPDGTGAADAAVESGCSTSNRGASDGLFPLLVAVGALTIAGRRRSRARDR